MVPMLPEVSHSRGRGEVAVLRRPHLVLADAGGDDGRTARVAVDFLDDVVRLDERAGAVVVHGVDALELAQLGDPGAEVAAEAQLAAVRAEHPQRLGNPSDMAPVHALDLVDFGAVDVEVGDAPGVAGELRPARPPRDHRSAPPRR